MGRKVLRKEHFFVFFRKCATMSKGYGLPEKGQFVKMLTEPQEQQTRTDEEEKS